MSNRVTSTQRQQLYAEAERLRTQGYTQEQIEAQLATQVSQQRARTAAAHAILRSRNPKRK